MDFKNYLTSAANSTWDLEEVDEQIEKKLPLLLQLINMDKITEILQSNNKLLPKYLGTIKSFEEDNQKKVNFVLRHMTRNETDVYQLIHILLHSGQDAAAYTLGLIFSLDLTPLIDLSKCDPSKGHIIPEQDKLTLLPGKNPGSMSNAYSMDKDIRGICLLVNNYFTVGTYLEMQRFRNIFHQLRFKVVMKKNLNAENIFLDLLTISKNPELSEHNAFIFMIITHGTENEEILGFDGKPLKIEYLTKLFDNEECKFLQNRPRLFFFNCCRGGYIDGGAPALGGASPLWNKPNIPTIQDFLICYSTLKGNLAYVDWIKGSFFGKWLAESFIEKIKYKDLNAVLNEAERKAGEDVHAFDWTQSMKRQIYFFEKEEIVKNK